MPPLNQPKELIFLCSSTLAILCAKRIQIINSDSQIKEIGLYISDLPASVLESIGFWILQSANGLLRCVSEKEHGGLDDKEIVKDQCNFLNKCLNVILHPKLREIDHDFVIDLRTFRNFEAGPAPNELENIEEGISETTKTLLVTDQNLDENPDFLEVSNTLKNFLKDLSSDNNALRHFHPGYFLIDRHNVESMDPHKLSLAWCQPMVLINLVDNCSNLLELNLEGYEELTDLALEYISGQTSQSTGLIFLEEIVLPKKSFVTESGIKVLLENLARLLLIRNSGKMGKLFDLGDLNFPAKLTHFSLIEFDQLESTTSGWIEEDGSDIGEDLEIRPWSPGEGTIARIAQHCPNLRCLRLLVEDRHLELFAKDAPDLKLRELEAHLTWSRETGLDLFAVTFAQTLTSIKLTFLDNYSLSVVQVIGQFCVNVGQFHLNIWSDDLEDIETLSNSNLTSCFPRLEDLKVQCEEYVESLPKELFCFLFGCHSKLKIAQYIGPIHWLELQHLQDLFDKFENSLEMVIISNTSFDQSMNLGMEAVRYFIDHFQNLTILGNLRTWKSIDYFDSDSPNYFRSESELSKLKETAKKKNWNIDFELENLEYLQL